MSPYSLTENHSYTFSSYQIPQKKRERMETPSIDLDSDHEYSLAELIDVGLLNNPDTKITWEDARVAAAQYGQSLQNYFPQIDASAVALRQKQPFIGPTNVSLFDTIYSGNLNLSYILLDFGQTRATSNAALYSLQNVDLSHTRTIQTTVQTIMNQYYSLIFEQELLFAKNQDIKNAYISFDAASEKLRTGIGDLGDVMQTKTYLLQTQLDYTQQKQALHTATTTLTDTLGVAPLERMKVQTFPEIIPASLDSLSTLTEIAKQQRPDYLAAMAKVLSNEETVKATITKNYPTLSGELEVGRTVVDGSNDKYDFIAALKLNIPLFEGFYMFNETKAAKSGLSIAKLQLQQLELEIEREISNYRQDILLSLEATALAKQYVEAAETDFKIQISKYKAGTNTIVDVINAQTEVANAAAKYIETKRDYFTSLANLTSAIGSLYRNQTLPEGDI